MGARRREHHPDQATNRGKTPTKYPGNRFRARKNLKEHPLPCMASGLFRTRKPSATADLRTPQPKRTRPAKPTFPNTNRHRQTKPPHPVLLTQQRPTKPKKQSKRGFCPYNLSHQIVEITSLRRAELSNNNRQTPPKKHKPEKGQHFVLFYRPKPMPDKKTKPRNLAATKNCPHPSDQKRCKTLGAEQTTRPPMLHLVLSPKVAKTENQKEPERWRNGQGSFRIGDLAPGTDNRDHCHGCRGRGY